MGSAVRLIVWATLIFSLHTEAATLDGRVAHVVDGDTLDVIVQGKRIRVRILDIDAPEQKQPYGHRSRQSLIAICGGESARIDGSKTDRNGRLLAQVRCNGVDAGAGQVRRGMAWVFVRYAPVDSPLHAIEHEARAARRGLWATLQPIPPWEWRQH
jgi:endonuclease YncB( thermonuclease family)